MSVENPRRNLWAPWRIEYIVGPKDGECFLCGREAPLSDDREKLIIARGKRAFALLNAYPYNSGHMMIAPYAHESDISALDRETWHEIADMTLIAKETLQKVMRPDAFNIGYNLGAAAGAGLETHLHQHIVPRWVGDTNFMPVLDNTRVVPQALEDTAELLRARWTS